MIFPVVRYGCKSWTIKKAEHQRIDAFELWSWRRLLKVPWTAGRSNLKEINPKYSLKYSLEGLMLKFHYFGHLMRRADSLEKDPEATKDWVKEEKGATEDEMVGWHHWLNGHEFEQTPGDSGGQESLACCNPRGCKEFDTTWWLNNKNNKVTLHKAGDIWFQRVGMRRGTLERHIRNKC